MLKTMKMTSFDLKNDLEVKFRGHQCLRFEKLYHVRKFWFSQFNRLISIELDLKCWDDGDGDEDDDYDDDNDDDRDGALVGDAIP